MRRLTLARHAKAEDKNPQTTDFDRALARRGHEQAESLALSLLDGGDVPNLLLASPARRARTTAEILSSRLRLAPDQLRYIDGLYLAQPSQLLQIIRSTEREIHHLMIVGHNPGLSELVTLLMPDAGLGELATAQARVITFQADTWAAVGKAAAL